jgi:hypothetical protein
MAEPEMRSFEEFWPFYVREHAHPTNRALHVVGTTLAMGSVAAGLLTGRRAFYVAAPVLGYGFAWVGHFLVQGNKPATFSHPLWSLRGDLVMWWKTLTGTMEAEVERATGAESTNGVHAEAPGDAAPVSREMN